MRKILLAATMLVGGGLISAPAHAVFVDSTSDFFSVAVPSTITFTFVGRSANDVDLLVNTNGGASTTIFNNQTTAPGAQFSQVFGPGQFTVQLRNTTQNTVYNPGTANPGNAVHLRSTMTFSDFNLGTTTVAAGIGGYYGWEDRPIGGPLTDYNDLVFTVTATPTPGAIPEPMSLAMLGVGLVGAGVARMRKGKAKA